MSQINQYIFIAINKCLIIYHKKLFCKLTISVFVLYIDIVSGKILNKDIMELNTTTTLTRPFINKI